MRGPRAWVNRELFEAVRSSWKDFREKAALGGEKAPTRQREGLVEKSLPA